MLENRVRSLFRVPTLRSACGALMILAGVVLGGCLSSAPLVPRPDTVYVPHPDHVPPGLSAEELLEQYAVSPNRDPDGLGVLPAVWLQSRMLLLVKEAALDLEARNRVAYARSEEEQAVAMAATRTFYQDHVVFEGWLAGDYDPGVDTDWYKPEGIYLIDDRGRKFHPIDTGPAAGARYYGMVLGWALRADLSPKPESYPRIIFPGEAIGPETRAVTLYFAALYRRMSFTWVFDPQYVPQPSGEGREYESDIKRLWGR